MKRKQTYNMLHQNLGKTKKLNQERNRWKKTEPVE